MRVVLERVTAGYRNRIALRDVDLGFNEGELSALVGPNGAGKTTLLRVIAGVLRPVAGEVRLDERPMSEFSPQELSRKIGVVAQDPAVSFDFTVWELVELGRLPFLNFPDRPRPVDREAVVRALELVGLSGLEGRRLSSLSGGERRKAFIAQALAREPELLLLDEPTAHLDIKTQLELLRLFWEWIEEGITVVTTAHDLNLATSFPRVVLLSEGKVFADGAPEEALSPERIREAFGVEARVIRDPDTGVHMIHFLLPRGP